MADVAVAAAVGKGTLYEYFDSKEALFETLVLETVEEALAGFADSAGSADPEEALREMVRFAVQNALVNELDVYRLFFDFWGVAAGRRAGTRKALREALGHFRAIVVGLVRRGQKAGRFSARVNAEQFARIFVAAIDGAGLQLVILEEPLQLDAYAAELEATLLGALLAPAALKGNP